MPVLNATVSMLSSSSLTGDATSHVNATVSMLSSSSLTGDAIKHVPFPYVLALAWRMRVNTYLVTDGVFTGVAGGYTDDKKAVIIGFLKDGATFKFGALRAGRGNDPSAITAWIGGIDGSGNPTYAPVDLDWSVLRSYRIFRDRAGVISVYVDGSIVASLRVTANDLPYLFELNDPFNSLQGTFFGSLSRMTKNTSTWSYVRYTVIPTNPMQTSPSVYVSYEGTAPPESVPQPWTPVGFHGTETIIGGNYLLLDSTSATDLATESVAGLVSGDFRGFSRIEPLIAASYDTILDVNVALLTYTHGITPNAVLAAFDDGDRLIQLSFFPDRAAPKFSYGGRSLPEKFSPYFWEYSYLHTPPLGNIEVSMVGQYLQILDDTTTDGIVYHLIDPTISTDANRVCTYLSEYMFEFKTQVLSYTPDLVGFCGVTASVYDGEKDIGLLLEDIAGTPYVTFHSEGNSIVAGRFAFTWNDGNFHTYRVVKAIAAPVDQVSLFIDGIFIGQIDYTDFTTPVASLTGLVSFGSSTPLSAQAKSTVLWAYANYWRVGSSTQKFAGIWKGYDPNSLLGYHLPLRISGRDASVNGNVLADLTANFTTAGVLHDENLIIDDGPNKGVYPIDVVAPAGDVTRVTISGTFPLQPSTVDYRIVRETDWSTSHKYRITKTLEGVFVFLDAATDAWISVDYSSQTLPPSSSGIGYTIAGGLPSVLWGAFDPTNLSQTLWDYVHFGAVRSQTEIGIVPPHQVLNQRNIMASFEHHRTNIPHSHTDFWSESEGIPPQTDPDLLRNPNLVASTLLNEGTPLVPSTQTYEIRQPTPVLVPIAGLNNPSDVLNTPSFILSDGEQKIEIVVPDDIIYNSLRVIESTTGEQGLVAPCDDYLSDLGTWSFQNTVCLDYDGSVLPEDDTAAPTPWSRISDDPSHAFASVAGGILTYGTDSTGTKTVYRNNTPLSDSKSLQTEVIFRLKVLNDSSSGLGDSQVRVGFSSPGVTIGLAFMTTSLGERYVLAVDLNNGRTVGGIPFDFLDGSYHDYRLIRDPGTAAIQILIDS